MKCLRFSSEENGLPDLHALELKFCDLDILRLNLQIFRDTLSEAEIWGVTLGKTVEEHSLIAKLSDYNIHCVASGTVSQVRRSLLVTLHKDILFILKHPTYSLHTFRSSSSTFMLSIGAQGKYLCANLQ